jgi:hypothetical protein
MYMEATPEAAVADKLYQHRAAVRRVIEQAKRPLTIAEVRQLAREQDPTLSSVLLACAADELRRQQKIRLAD